MVALCSARTPCFAPLCWAVVAVEIDGRRQNMLLIAQELGVVVVCFLQKQTDA